MAFLLQETLDFLLQENSASISPSISASQSPIHRVQVAVVKSMDDDGFTLTWAKSGSPSGTAGLRFLCIR